jgi:Putative adhesin
MGSMKVDNRKGDIQIYLPDKAGFQVDARARNGEVQTDFDQLKINNSNDQAIATGTIGGGGPHLVVNNEHGTIEIRKASSAAEAPEAPSPPKAPKAPRVPAPPKTPQVTEN